MSGVGSWSGLLEVEWRHVQRWDQTHHMHRSVNCCCESHERAICKYDRSPLLASICLIPCGSSDAIYVGLVLNASSLMLAISVTMNPVNRLLASWMNRFLDTSLAINRPQNLPSILVPSLTPCHKFCCTTFTIKPNYNHILCLFGINANYIVGMVATEADMLNLPFEDQSFDVVIEKGAMVRTSRANLWSYRWPCMVGANVWFELIQHLYCISLRSGCPHLTLKT